MALTTKTSCDFPIEMDTNAWLRVATKNPTISKELIVGARNRSNETLSMDVKERKKWSETVEKQNQYIPFSSVTRDPVFKRGISEFHCAGRNPNLFKQSEWTPSISANLLFGFLPANHKLRQQFRNYSINEKLERIKALGIDYLIGCLAESNAQRLVKACKTNRSNCSLNR